jgi:hypothetical protein
MKRRAFLALAAVTSGVLAISRLIEYWQTLQLQAITPLPTMPTPIPRSEWDARPVNHEAANEYGIASETNPAGWLDYGDDLKTVYHTLSVHHTGVAQVFNETMRSIQDEHLDTRGWADIGYHFGIDPQGRIYNGRDIHARGSSVAGGNTGMIGVVVMGDFELESPTDAQLAALQTLTNWLTQTYALTYLAAHSELNPGITVCPGRFMQPYLDVLANGAGLSRQEPL